MKTCKPHECSLFWRNEFCAWIPDPFLTSGMKIKLDVNMGFTDESAATLYRWQHVTSPFCNLEYLRAQLVPGGWIWSGDAKWCSWGEIHGSVCFDCRHWLVITEDGHMVTGRQQPAMVLVSLTCEGDQLCLNGPNMEELRFLFQLSDNAVIDCRFHIRVLATRSSLTDSITVCFIVCFYLTWTHLQFCVFYFIQSIKSNTIQYYSL